MFLKNIGGLKKFAKDDVDVTIDNAFCKLHYILTTSILIISALLVTSQELIGEHIKCISDSGIPNNVLTTFCFFTTTFTVVCILLLLTINHYY